MKKILQRIPRMLLVGVLLLILLAGSALAYLFSSTREGATSNFTPAKDSDPTINDTSFYVNVGDPGYAVYVRAAIVVNWEENGKDADGNETVTDTGIFHATAPVAGTDYTLTLNTTDWFQCKYDDETDFYFYYHKEPVAYDGTNENSKYTKVLINSCQVKDGAAVPDGYHLDVQIIAQTIQALGTTDADDTPAVTNAWGIAVDSFGNLVEPTP